MMRYRSRQRRRTPCLQRTQCRRIRLSRPQCLRISQRRKMCMLLPMLPLLTRRGTSPPGKIYRPLRYTHLQQRCTCQPGTPRMWQHHQPPPHLKICQPDMPYIRLIQMILCMSQPRSRRRCGRPQCTLRHTRSWLHQCQSERDRHTRNRWTAPFHLSRSRPRKPYKGRCQLNSCGCLAHTENNPCQ